jgi:GTP-binding protein SAR1
MVLSSLYETWQSILNSIWRALGLEGKEGSLVVLGLDNAGKTTLLHRLRTGGDVRSFPPTDRPYQTEKFTCQGLTFSAWDLGGHEAVRHLWEDYVCESSAVLFVIDASDNTRLEEAGFELDALIGEKVVADVPVAVLLNKCDLEEALSSAEICQRIKYDELQRLQGEDKIAIFRISVLRGEGYQAAFRWVANFLEF